MAKSWEWKLSACFAAVVTAAGAAAIFRRRRPETELQPTRQPQSQHISPPATAASLLVTGQSFIVTGGAMGIGEACARHLAAQQAAGVLLFDRDPLGANTAAQIQAEHAECQVR